MGLQETEAKPLPRLVQLHLLESRENWLASGLNLVEPGAVQPPDLRARHSEDLPQDLVAHEGCVFRRSHQLSEL